MPDYLAIDWERTRISGVEASAGRGKVRVRQVFDFAWPEEFKDETPPEQVGGWLKQQLKDAGIGQHAVLVSLPREDAVVRMLELPDVPDDDLPDIVRLQAETRAAASLDKMLLDFLPLPKRPDANVRDVLTTTLSKERANRIRAIVEAAGLELAAIGLSPVATAELAARAETRRNLDPKDIALVVACHGQRAEISLMKHRRLVLTHSARLHGDSSTANQRSLLAEIRRLFMAQEQLGGRPARVWVIGSESDAELASVLADGLSCPAELIDPLNDEDVAASAKASEASRGALAGPIGMVLAASGAVSEHVDYVNPRKPVVKADRRKVAMIAGLAGAAVVLMGTVGGTWYYRSKLDARIETLDREHRSMASANKNEQPTLDRAATMQKWVDESVDLRKHMLRINEALPGTDRIYLRDFRLERSSASGAKGRIVATVFARDRVDIQNLDQRLVDANYRLTTQEIKTTTKEPYKFQYTMIVDIVDDKPATEKKDAT